MNKSEHLYVIKKYIVASSIQEVLRVEKDYQPVEVFIADDHSHLISVADERKKQRKRRKKK